ncbi:MAG: AMP-binding protein, partial [Pseudomonadales bacterium]
MVAIAGGWNYGDIYDALGAALPADAPALIHGDRAISWGEFTARSNRLARALGAAGLTADSKVGFYCRNHPAYMEMLAACFKGRFVHVNVNYRYVDEELYYIFDNSDAEAVLYAREFAPQVEALKARLPKVKCFIEVSDDTDVVLDGALSYEALAQNGDGSPLGIPRSGDDLLFL